MGRLGLVAFFLLLSLPASASAAPAARLIYGRTPEASSCPAEGALRRAVAARVGYDPFFPWAKETILVHVWREHGRHRARVELLDDQGMTRGARELSSAAPDCTELFDAMALAISISLDAVAALQPTSPEDGPERRVPAGVLGPRGGILRLGALRELRLHRARGQSRRGARAPGHSLQ
jgi:hypothetical protein